MWLKEHQDWILAMDNLFNQIFGGDFLAYKYDDKKGTSIREDTLPPPLLEYNHDEWETEYLKEETKFSGKETASNASVQNCVVKQPDMPKQILLMKLATLHALRLSLLKS